MLWRSCSKNLVYGYCAFLGCSSLETLDLSGWDTGKMTDTSTMFADCSSLQTIYVGDSWSTASVTISDGMFSGCEALVGGEGTSYDSSNTDAAYACVDGDGGPGYLTRKAAPQPSSDVTIDFSEQGFENAQAIEDPVEQGGVTVTFNKGSGNTPPKYYSVGEAVRLYAKGTMTVTSDTPMTSIEIAFGEGDGTNTILVSTGKLEGATWTGGTTEVTFTIGGDSKHRRIHALTVSFVGGAPAAIYTVTFENWDGSILSTAEYEEGTLADDIEQPDTPTKRADEQYTYEFAGWDPEVADVTADATYTATARPNQIVRHPEDATAEVGQRFTLSVEATGAVESYSWENSRSGGTSWSDVTWLGHDSATLSYRMVDAVDGRMFRCVVTFADGTSATSEPATVGLPEPSGRITAQPAGASAAVGARFTLSVAAEGAVAYAWQNSRTGGSWSDVTWAGHDTDTLSHRMSESLDGRMFRCVVTFADGSTEASGAATVSLAAPASGRITGQPEDASAADGSSFALAVAADGAAAYSWQHSKTGSSWSDVAWRGHDTATLSYRMSSSLDGRMFRCVVTFADGTAEVSDVATVTLAAAPA